MRARLLGACSAIAVSAMLLTGTASAETPPNQLVVGMNMANLTSLDPHNMNSYETHHILSNVYDTLVRTDPKDPKALLPQAAESWEASEDGTITFHLRDDIEFHSGNTLTAEDVAFSLQRAVKLNLLGAAYFKEWGYTAENVDEKFRAVDDTTFVMDPIKPIAPNLKLYVLARAVGAILDREVVAEHEVDGDMARGWMATNSAGSGPFQLARWNANDIVLLERFDDYWEGEPTMRRVIVRHIPESQTQRLQLEQGDLDVGIQLSSADLDGLAAGDNVTVEKIPGAGYYYFIMSTKDPDLAKPEVRRALIYCIDYEGIDKGVMQNYGLLADNFVPQGVPGAIEPLGHTLDVERCKQGLADAGYPNGLRKSLRVLTSPPYAEIATAVQATMAQAGVTLDILPGNGEQTYGPQRNRQFEMGIGRSSSAVHADPDGWLRTHVYNPDNDDDAGFSNLLGWRSALFLPEVNRLMDEGATMTDDAKRMPLYQEAQRLYEEAGPSVVPVSQRVDPYAISNRVKNYVGNPTWMVRWNVVEKE
ncbi:ABC transporter substrate-binding protein [Marinivivus vitaminiproducens]|uniref:ABC transporter substrate-binding protein n=1 Tax=Marinivivus vitaminiproducens TaxID=3035935 RepID=UPI00279A0FCE|nr:ABC transporter substrate-binding protein [Geminicoccaceae bacterium SCSIO 64248]